VVFEVGGFMDIQKLMDTINDVGRNTRADYHLTLGDLIKSLEEASDLNREVKYADGKSPHDAHSYRGYYSDLAFDDGPQSIKAHELLKAARGWIGKTFEGYKGGDYVMDADTPLWRAEYGDCGDAIVAIQELPDYILLVTKKID
jgi:hypothetical protein